MRTNRFADAVPYLSRFMSLDLGALESGKAPLFMDQENSMTTGAAVETCRKSRDEVVQFFSQEVNDHVRAGNESAIISILEYLAELQAHLVGVEKWSQSMVVCRLRNLEESTGCSMNSSDGNF